MKLKKIAPGIFHLSFKDSYDLAMHFLRYQEYYESPKFKGKIFTLIDFMEWYAKKYGKGRFTYPTDWAGFNIPGEIIAEMHTAGIPDYNKYDAAMKQVFEKCRKQYDKFYLIGTTSHADLITFRHELAHAFYHISSSYKKEMDELIKKISKAKKNAYIKKFVEMGYHKSVFPDEIQAYSISDGNSQFLKVLNKYAGLKN